MLVSRRASGGDRELDRVVRNAGISHGCNFDDGGAASPRHPTCFRASHHRRANVAGEPGRGRHEPWARKSCTLPIGRRTFLLLPALASTVASRAVLAIARDDDATALPAAEPARGPAVALQEAGAPESVEEARGTGQGEEEAGEIVDDAEGMEVDEGWQQMAAPVHVQ